MDEHSIQKKNSKLTRRHGRRGGSRPVRVGQALRVHVPLAAFLHALDLLQGEEGSIDGSVQRSTARRRAADRASRCGQWGGRGEAVEVSTDKPGVQRHEARRALLDHDCRLEVRRLWRGNGGHVHGTLERALGCHLVLHVQSVCSVDRLWFRHAVRRLESRHVSTELHLGWVRGVVVSLLLRLGIGCVEVE